ncbi:alpha-2-macroglobulin family protein [Planctomicrobium sp. SH661]|uniref:alpha-2-macroglobulin family protein n=1 Tax=Planctomicrobium sp. SH661 TaxID=3448124 RepID=UPI003F5B9171
MSLLLSFPGFKTAWVRLSAVTLTLACTGMIFLMAAEPSPQDQRQQAEKLQKDGNYQDAYVIFEKLALDPKTDPLLAPEDLRQAVNCLQQLQRQSEYDALFQKAIDAHPEDWRIYAKAASLIDNAEHYGFIVAGEFSRGNQRGGGAFVNTWERDRAQAIIWMNQARLKLPEDLPGNEKANFYFQFANLLALQGQQAWQLQDLTSLETLPDYPEAITGRGRFRGGFGGYGGGESRGAPVDEQGNPIFIQIPESFDAAKTDGERWRWCLQQMAEFNPAMKNQSRYLFATFLHGQFGVQTLQQWGISLPRSSESSKPDDEGTWSLPGLKDDETIARLANGVKRFSLPDEFNFIKIFKDIAGDANGSDQSYQQQSLDALASIFENRQQYPTAAKYWQASLQRFPQQPEGRKARLDQIIKAWGQFEPVMSTAAGSGATVDFKFRNAKSVSFEAHRIKIPELIGDVQKYLETKPQELDWQKMQIGNIGYQLVNQNDRKYLGEKVADWSLELQPRENHFDRRITVTTPLQKAGAYLVTAKIADGNTTRIILWLNDTAIVKKPLSNKMLYYVADAVTGKPVNHAHVQFFGGKQEYDQNAKKPRILTQKFAEFTNPDGMIVLDEKIAQPNYQWLATAKTDDGRFAYLGFSGIWYSKIDDPRYNEAKTYIVTDRPVYRPDQKVQFKFWIREVKYDQNQGSKFAKQKFQVKINDPQGTEVFSQVFETDEFGGLAGEYALPKQAALGSYQIYLDPNFRNGLTGLGIGLQPVHGSNQFRVEEYKKPEFEVTVDAPEKPVQLGDKITATIKAKYYYGAPVTSARVKYKVERSTHDTTWFPYDPWDWLYGNGYWWFSPDYNWYPGFRAWGCIAPRPSWIHWNQNPPELILDQEVEIGPDGTVQIEIDTSLAKALHSDQDHEYSISAEVTDASRRTIVGSGKVLVSREPFKIFAWTNRGYYNVGDKIEAKFQARSLDGKGIAGAGKLQLLKITYKDDKPVETVAQEWDLSTNDEGLAEQTITASEGGQYRLSFKLPSGEEGKFIEGGYLFVIRGQGFDGSQFEFNDLELVADKKTYAPGEKVRLMVNTNRVGSTVLLFVRPTNGIAKTVPKVLTLTGKSTLVEIDVEANYMPNFFVEAITVSQGKLYDQIQELMVPPTQKVLNVEVVSSSESYLPGAKAEVEVKVTDLKGEPVVGAVLLSVYDRAVEYISGGSNVTEIKEFFWKWRRSTNPNSETNLQHWFHQLLANNETGMQNLGVFGGEVADRDQNIAMAGVPVRSLDKSLRGGISGRMQMMNEMAAPAAAPLASFAADAAMEKSANGAAAGGGGDMVAPTVRTNFADTAFWKADIVTDKSGIAKVTFDMPENLSSWKIRAWGLSGGTDVGEATREVVTAKNLVVRLQAPRFFVETDEVVLSAVVHNYLKTEKEVKVELALEGETLTLMDAVGDSTFNLKPSTTITIPAGGEHRVDWRVKAVQPGNATITMKALTDEESDAMQMTFPVIVHGILKTESFSGVIRPDVETGVVEFTVPEDRQPEQSRIEVRYLPTLAGAMVDALPYLVDYPYGCTEQTLNRFVPTVITQHILLDMGLDLKAIQEKRTNLNAQEIGDPAERAKQWKRFDRNPVFDADEVAAMVKTGVKDLTAMQNSDGGWGWFSGFQEQSYAHTTAVVVHGLQLAVKNDVALTEGVLENGIAWLKKYQAEQIALLQEGERHEKDPERKERFKTQCDDMDAMVFSVLVDGKVVEAEMQRFLYRDRLKVSLYSQALLGLALHEIGAIEQRDMIVKNIDQFIKVDEENQTAFLDLPNNNYWWYWYGNTVEANAQYLKLLTRVNVKDPKASGLVKYLINNRRHGTYWNSTRDTAYCIEALAEYLVASGEGKPNMQVEVWLDGELKQTVEITPEVLFTFENGFILEGEAVTAGKHKLELKRKSLTPDPNSLSPLYYNAYVTNFTKEEFITAAGLEIKVGRKYYRLVQDKEATKAVAGDRGQVIDQSILKYKREELKSLEEVVSGDLIEIELEIDSKNDYEYVVFEDMKAAGCESVDLQSGYTSGGLGAYVEFRDQKVAFFLRQLARGKHSVSYRVRAEIPGQFSALPTQAHAMYAPELRANSDEMKLRIEDLPKSAEGN